MIITTENPLPKVYYDTLGLKEKELWHISKVKEWHKEDVTGIITSLSKEILDLTQFENLKWVATPTTGHDHLDMETINEKGIILLSLQGEPILRDIWATAEHTIALMFALAKNLNQNQKITEKEGWERSYKSIELSEKKLLIIGYGRIGKQVEEMASVLGMNVLAVERNGFRDDNFPKLAWESDFVSVHVNLTEENKNMCNEKFFDAMKPNSFFINTSRGDIVDENALLRALATGHLKGAALDVVKGEHDNTRNKMLCDHARRYGNLILTPHVAGYTSESRVATDKFLAEKIKEYLLLEGFANANLSRV